MDAIWGGLLSFLLTIVGIRLLRPVAHRFDLVDSPCGHKIHNGDVPLVGGLAMYLAFGFVLLLFSPYQHLPIATGIVFAGAGLMVIMGWLDDMYHVNVHWRFLAQAVAGLLVALLGGVVLLDFGYLLTSSHLVTLGIVSIPMTVFVFMGGVCAMNMADGLDGLAGGLALVTLASLLTVATIGGDAGYVFILGALIGAVAGFLVFNFRWSGKQRADVFMGDAGSMFLGFLITWALIDIAQAPQQMMSPVTALWIFAVPLIDTVRLLLCRTLRGVSPFCAGRDHLHHYLRDAGLSVRQAVIVLIGLQLLFSSIGLAGLYAGIGEYIMFYSFMVVSLVIFFSLRDAEKGALLLRKLLQV